MPFRALLLVAAAAFADVVDTDDSEDADSDSGDPARRTFLRFRGLPFSFGAVGLYRDFKYIPKCGL